MANFRALILQRHRHLKWKAFDWLEAVLMVLCGVCIFMFTLTVLCDVVTRTLGVPWLWLQQVTTAFFAWGVFVGTAAAHAPQRPLLPDRDHQAHDRRVAHLHRGRESSDRAGRVGAAHLVRLEERDPRPRQLPDAIAATADGLHGHCPGGRRADRAVHDRAARQRLEARIRGSGGPRQSAGGDRTERSNGL